MGSPVLLDRLVVVLLLLPHRGGLPQLVVAAAAAIVSRGEGWGGLPWGWLGAAGMPTDCIGVKEWREDGGKLVELSWEREALLSPLLLLLFVLMSLVLEVLPASSMSRLGRSSWGHVEGGDRWKAGGLGSNGGVGRAGAAGAAGVSLWLLEVLCPLPAAEGEASSVSG